MEQEIQDAFQKYMSTYFSRRNYKELMLMLDDEMTGIGTAEDEVALDANQAKKIYKRDISQVPTPIHVNIHQKKVQVLSPSVAMVNSLITISGFAEGMDFELSNLRQSVTFVKKRDEWLIAHVHISLPANDLKEGESFPLEELKEQNLKLKESIKRKISELEETNERLESKILEHKNVRKRLEESEKKLKAIFDTANIGISITNTKGRYVMFNKWWTDYLGYSDDEIERKTNLEITHPDDLPVSRQQFMKVLKGELNSYMLEKRYVRKDGTCVWGNLSVSPIKDTSGKVLYMVGMVNNLTQRKKVEEALRINEEKFRTLVENLSEILYILDENAVIKYISPNIETLSGYTVDEVIGKPFTIFVHPDDIEGRGEQFKKTLSGTPEPSVYRLVTKTGTSFWMRTNAKPLIKDGQALGVQGVLTDITNLKLVEEELRISEANLKELNATKDKFFSVLAHDLKSPFNSMLGFLNLLSKNVKNNDIFTTERQINMILDSAKHVFNLLENTLMWAGSQSGKIHFNPERIVVSSFCNSIIDDLELSAYNKNIKVSFFEAESAVVYADKNMLSTIIRNLLSNAIKFSNPDGKIDLYVIKDIQGTKISVSDNGVGIDKVTREKLFNLSEKISTTGTANERGTGLGLILCKEFVERHGGEVWVESEYGKGSTFTFSIPNTDNLNVIN